MYSIIETTNEAGEKEVSIACTKWIVNDQIVKWPNKNYVTALKKKLDPDDCWKQYKCRIFKNSIGTLSNL